MSGSGLERYMMQGLAFAIFVIGFMFYLFYLRSKYQKQSIDHVQCEFIREEGTGYFALLKVTEGFVQLPFRTEGNPQISTKDYRVADLATVLEDYPMGWIPRFLRTKIRKITFVEWCFEPLFSFKRPNDVTLSPILLGNIRSEKFSEIGARHAQEQTEREASGGGKMKVSNALIFCMVLVVVCIVGLAIFIYIKFGDIMPILGKIATALGV